MSVFIFVLYTNLKLSDNYLSERTWSLKNSKKTKQRKKTKQSQVGPCLIKN